MKRRCTVALMFLILLLTGCGEKQVEVPVTTTSIKYKVDTGSVVEVIMQSDDDCSIVADADGSVITQYGEGIADVEFAVTTEVLSYTKDVVPTVIANYPAFKLPSTKDDMLALVLNDDTTMILTALADIDSMTSAINECTIFIY